MTKPKAKAIAPVKPVVQPIEKPVVKKGNVITFTTLSKKTKADTTGKVSKLVVPETKKDVKPNIMKQVQKPVIKKPTPKLAVKKIVPVVKKETVNKPAAMKASNTVVLSDILGKPVEQKQLPIVVIKQEPVQELKPIEKISFKDLMNKPSYTF